jgi:hypothetical protein
VPEVEGMAHARSVTMPNARPSLIARYASDEGRLYEEVRVLAVREQAAIVRALADELEALAPWGTTGTLRQQLVEELARLGCRILETAATLSRTAEAGPVSCVLLRSPGEHS